MKPFAGESTKGSLKTVFNYKLSQACHIVENSLGLLASLFRIYHKPLNVKTSTVEDSTLTFIYLHNFLRRNSTAKQFQSPPGTLDFKNTDNDTVTEGEGKATPLQALRVPGG